METTLMMIPAEVALFALLAGWVLGAWLQNRRWRANAETYLRIESGGRVYKVEYDE